MGETGPCGPCSEIHYYIGDDLSNQSKEGVNKADEYWELWNLIFIQNERLAAGSLITFSQCHFDTGAGLDQLTSLTQGNTTNHETDLFQQYIQTFEPRLCCT